MNEETQENDKENVPQEVLDRALGLVQKSVRGNGLKTSSISFDDFDGEVLNFEAGITFKIEPDISEKQHHGRQSADEIVGSKADMRQKVINFIGQATKNPKVQKSTLNILKKRDDLGFAQDDQIINLESFKKTIGVHEHCQPCSSSGNVLCANCNGQGRETCHRCNGKGEENCNQCRGEGVIYGQNNQQQQCNFCHGQGMATCTLCQHSGEVTCSICKTKGQIPCDQCSGTGWHSLISQIKIIAKGNFNYSKENLPEEVPALIDDLGPLLVTEKHGDVEIIDDSTFIKDLENESGENEYIIPYHVRIPYGDIKFKIQEKHEIAGKLFGFQPLLLEMPNFIEKSTSRGRLKLIDASSNAKNTATGLRAAIKYRVIRESFIATARMTQKKAVVKISRRYPFGMSLEVIEQIIEQSGTALNLITKKPRTVGIIAGSIFFAVICAVYFIGGLRVNISSSINNPPLQIFIDILLPIIGGTISTIISKILAKKAIEKIIGDLLPQKQKKLLIPKAGKSAIWAYGAAILIYFIIMQISVMVGGAAPEWYIY